MTVDLGRTLILIFILLVMLVLPILALADLFRKGNWASGNAYLLWITLILLLPGLGAAAYFVFGPSSTNQGKKT